MLGKQNHTGQFSLYQTRLNTLVSPSSYRSEGVLPHPEGPRDSPGGSLPHLRRVVEYREVLQNQ